MLSVSYLLPVMIKSIFINLLTEVAEQEINKELQSLISLQLGLQDNLDNPDDPTRLQTCKAIRIVIIW